MRLYQNVTFLLKQKLVLLNSAAQGENALGIRSAVDITEAEWFSADSTSVHGKKISTSFPQALSSCALTLGAGDGSFGIDFFQVHLLVWR